MTPSPTKSMFTLPLYPFIITTKRYFQLATVQNRIPNCHVVIWQKNYPHPPATWACASGQTLPARIRVPSVENEDDLFGAHIEVRVMTVALDACISRFCVWSQHNELCVATPNDQYRDIDNLGHDLHSTRRVIRGCAPLPAEFPLTLRSAGIHLFASVGGTTVPIDYSCYT